MPEPISTQRGPRLVDLHPGRGDQGRRRVDGHVLRVAVPLLLIAAWQGASLLQVSADVLPPPSEVLAALAGLWRDGDLQTAVPTSLGRAVLGLLFGGGFGLIAGLAAGLWQRGEEVLDAPLQMLRTIPFIALIPLFITWFGIGELPKITLIAAATVFPMYLNAYAGVRNVDSKLIEAGSTFGLKGLPLITRIILPMSLPSVLTGLRLSAGISLLALVAAEQINATSGIGQIVMSAGQNQRPDIIIAGIVIYAILGICIDLAMRWIERLLLPWRASHVIA